MNISHVFFNKLDNLESILNSMSTSFDNNILAMIFKELGSCIADIGIDIHTCFDTNFPSLVVTVRILFHYLILAEVEIFKFILLISM